MPIARSCLTRPTEIVGNLQQNLGKPQILYGSQALKRLNWKGNSESVLRFNESKQKAQDLEKRLDEATLDRENYVSREEHEKAPRDLLGPSSSVIKMIESNINASQNVYMSIFMPPSDVAQGPWADESDQFAMLNHPVALDDMEPMLSTSDPLAGLPDFDMYEALP